MTSRVLQAVAIAFAGASLLSPAAAPTTTTLLTYNVSYMNGCC
jgi:hypothetical protein